MKAWCAVPVLMRWNLTAKTKMPYLGSWIPLLCRDSTMDTVLLWAYTQIFATYAGGFSLVMKEICFAPTRWLKGPITWYMAYLSQIQSSNLFHFNYFQYSEKPKVQHWLLYSCVCERERVTRRNLLPSIPIHFTLHPPRFVYRSAQLFKLTALFLHICSLRFVGPSGVIAETGRTTQINYPECCISSSLSLHPLSYQSALAR